MRALVLSGGGCKGAFQVGVIEQLVERGHDWEFIAGVSVGALNASLLAEYPVGKTREAAQKLEQLWLSISGNHDVWRHWFPLGPLEALWKESLYDSTPLARLVHEHVDEKAIARSGRQARFGAVAYGSGSYHEASQDSPNLCHWILASAAFPAFLTPQHLDGDVWIDGGARRITPLKSAIQAGASEIDVVLTSPRSTAPASPRGLNAIKVALRAIELMNDELFARDLKVAGLYNHLSRSGQAPQKRQVGLNVYEPAEPLVTGAEYAALEFDPAAIRKMLELGRQVGQGEPQAP